MKNSAKAGIAGLPGLVVALAGRAVAGFSRARNRVVAPFAVAFGRPAATAQPQAEELRPGLQRGRRAKALLRSRLDE